MSKKSIMPLCAIITCKNRSVKQNLTHGGVSYHRFPRNPDVKEKWIAATGRQNWIPSNVATICSDHFEPQHFVQKTGERRYLNTLAVPSQKLYPLRHVQPTTVPKFLSVNPSSSSAVYTEFKPQLYTSFSQGTPFKPVSVFSPPAVDHDTHSSESVNEETSIEVEIMPENSIILRSRDNRDYMNPEVIDSHTREGDRRVMDLMRAKIREQDLLIRKLQVRNHRLKKRLFSLKSMEAMEN